MDIEILCNVKVGGKILKAGFHQVDDATAKSLIADGLAIEGKPQVNRPADPVKAQNAKTDQDEEKQSPKAAAKK